VYGTMDALSTLGIRISLTGGQAGAQHNLRSRCHPLLGLGGVGGLKQHMVPVSRDWMHGCW
jgi:hypothetical protein